MAKRKPDETRNGCKIHPIIKDIPNARGGTLKALVYRVTKGRQIIDDGALTLEDAQRIADAQPPLTA